MKTLLTFLFAFTFLASSAQFLSYFDNNPRWLMHSSCGYYYPCVEEEDYVYFLDGDTTIQNTVYHKVMRRFYMKEMWYQSTPPPPGSCNTISSGTYLTALVRQQNEQIRIWDGSAEELLYDFDLQVGDTLPETVNGSIDTILVTSIDTLFLNGVAHRRYFLSGNGPGFLVEGIGHEFGFIERFPPSLECGYEVRCYENNGIVAYPNANSQCVWNASLEENETILGFDLHPNPVGDILQVQMRDFNQETSFVIHDCFGREILVFVVKNEKGLGVDLSGLKPGSYFITSSGSQSLKSMKFVKL